MIEEGSVSARNWAPAPQPRAPWWRSRWAGAALAAFLVFDCAAGAALIGRHGDSKAAIADQAPVAAPAAPTSAPPGAPGPAFGAKVGATLHVSDNGTRLHVTVLKVRSARSCRGDLAQPVRGRWVVANVLIRVVTGPATVGPLTFTWVAGDGTTSDGLSGIMANCGPALRSAAGLPAGAVRAGVVTFDVPAGAGDIEYVPYPGGPVTGSWHIDG